MDTPVPESFAQSAIYGGGGSSGAPTQSQITSVMGPDIQTVTPVAGATVQVANNNRNTTLVVNPAGDLLTGTLTINLPSEANSVVGQIITVRFRRSVTNVAIGGATTILGTIVAAVADGAVMYQKTAANTWEAISS